MLTPAVYSNCPHEIRVTQSRPQKSYEWTPRASADAESDEDAHVNTWASVMTSCTCEEVLSRVILESEGSLNVLVMGLFLCGVRPRMEMEICIIVTSSFRNVSIMSWRLLWEAEDTPRQIASNSVAVELLQRRPRARPRGCLRAEEPQSHRRPPTSDALSPTPTQPAHSSTPTPPALSPTPTQPALLPTPTQPALSPTPAQPALLPTPTQPALTPTPTPPALSPTPTPPALSPTPTPPALSPTPTPPALSPTPPPPTWDGEDATGDHRLLGY
ncbi:platelet glycoprotein Ib alpha chain-like [Penaeus chinensis]|uniref:platelet glycoprotein Ib alpha chain-like n=1 Tax=Penaeus chinensis TaxID=139456 RepID=UPI001FB66557|nr:platelet glycoprotein Ib alpha chain-like [Penaeus chinensis]